MYAQFEWEHIYPHLKSPALKAVEQKYRKKFATNEPDLFTHLPESATLEDYIQNLTQCLATGEPIPPSMFKGEIMPEDAEY